MKIECFHIPSLTSDLDLYYCGREIVDRDFTCGPYTRENYLIHYAIQGKGFFECRGKRHAVQAGDIFAIFPGDLTCYETDATDPWEFCWFAFNGRRAGELLTRASVTPEHPVKRIENGEAIPDHIDRMIETLQSGWVGTNSRLQGELYLLIAILEESAAPSQKEAKESRDASDYIRKAHKFIETHYQNAISIQMIAEYVGLERTYFTKLFTRLTGESPQQYLIKYRIDKCIQLMKTTDLNLNQICKSAGIEELTYFSRLFKNVMGVAPKRYCQELRQGRALTKR